MKTEDLVIGMKIKIPKTKMLKEYDKNSGRDSAVVARANKIGQKFLYYTGKWREHLCFSENQFDFETGDFFLAEEVEPFCVLEQLKLDFGE